MSLSVSMIAHPNADPSIKADAEWIEAILKIREEFTDKTENGYIVRKGDPEGFAKAMYGLYRDMCGKWDYVDADDNFVCVKPPVTVDAPPPGFYNAWLSKHFGEKGVKLTIVRS